MRAWSRVATLALNLRALLDTELATLYEEPDSAQHHANDSPIINAMYDALCILRYRTDTSEQD